MAGIPNNGGIQQGKSVPVDLASFDNSWYRPGSAVKRGLWYLCSLLFFQLPLPFPSALKAALLRLFGGAIGGGLVIKPRVQIKYPWFLEVGENVWIGEGVWIDNLCPVKIANNVCISQGAYLLTGNHDYKKASFDLIVSPIVIEEGAWVGAKAVICPGAVVKSHAVITVGSVLHKVAEPYTIYSGNPATPLRKRELS